MAYDKDKLYKQALETAKEKKCFFVEQLVSFLPCDKTTYYEHFKVNSNENNSIKEILDANKIEVKSAMYKKWFDSSNATLQIGLMKLLGTDEERKKLSSTFLDHTSNNKELKGFTIEWGDKKIDV